MGRPGPAQMLPYELRRPIWFESCRRGHMTFPLYGRGQACGGGGEEAMLDAGFIPGQIGPGLVA